MALLISEICAGDAIQIASTYFGAGFRVDLEGCLDSKGLTGGGPTRSACVESEKAGTSFSGDEVA